MSSSGGANFSTSDLLLESVWQFARDAGRGILDLIYPPKCLVCGDLQEYYLCPKCVSRIDYLVPPVCDRCGLPVEEISCRNIHCKTLNFTRARAVAVYDGVIREAIHQLKYSGCTVLMAELNALLVDYLATYSDFAGDATAVIPIPIHASRERERGFNQSALLARGVSEYLRMPLLMHVLERVGGLRPQAELSEHERIDNVKGAFRVSPNLSLQGERVLLIDDVLTTGSTTSEASKVLREAGAARVYVFTLARSC
jgi:competence protein ComFC